MIILREIKVIKLIREVIQLRFFFSRIKLRKGYVKENNYKENPS